MSGRKHNLPLDALIFDMDGVLVDVSASYRQAIIQTVNRFFDTGLALDYDGEPVSLLDAEDVDALKLAGGFNNDWDLTRAFIIYFLEMLPPLPMPTFPLRRHVAAILAYLQVARGGHLPVTMNLLRQNKDIPRLARRVQAAGGGLPAIERVLTQRNRHLIETGDNLLKGNLIQRIFQELYLGATLFEKVYGEKAVIAQTEGFIHNETLLIAPDVLATLAAELQLGIATGRPRLEAEYTLDRLGVSDFFQSLVTHDDIVAAGAEGKPAPWSLLEAARRLHPTPARSAYVGDTPDDIRAAKAASQTVPFLAIGVLAAAADKTALQRHFEAAGADIILSHPNRLPDILFRSA
ncbi:MAG: TIGR01548 family HAD-type hydrolase [Caldilineae bacterium]|nr:MAG: TIGR01548 family HAD-type hydrolase [Caldilineae bacterium]